MAAGGLAIALAAAVLAGKPAANSLKGCEVFGPAFGVDRLLRCANVTIEIYPPIAVALEESAMLEVARNASFQPGEKEALMAARPIVAGKKRVAVRYIRRRADATDPGLVIALPAGKGLSRIVHCSRDYEPYCQDLLELAVRALPPPTEPLPEGPPAIAGRALSVPKACTRRDRGVLTCGETELVWAQLPAHAPQTLSEVDVMVRRANLHLGPVEIVDRSCEVEKTDAICREATVAGKDGKRRRFVYGFAEVRGAKLFVSCSTLNDLSKGFPAPCGQVMAVKTAPRSD